MVSTIDSDMVATVVCAPDRVAGGGSAELPAAADAGGGGAKRHGYGALDPLDTEQAGKVVRLSGRTLEGLRVRGGGPVYRKLAGRVFYTLTDLQAWVDAQARSSTSDPGTDPLKP